MISSPEPSFSTAPFNALIDQIIIQRRLIFQINL